MSRGCRGRKEEKIWNHNNNQHQRGGRRRRRRTRMERERRVADNRGRERVHQGSRTKVEQFHLQIARLLLGKPFT